MSTTTVSKKQPLKRLSLVQSTASFYSPSSSVGITSTPTRSDEFSNADNPPTPHSSVPSATPLSSSSGCSSFDFRNARRKSSIYYVTACSESEKFSPISISPSNEIDISPQIELSGQRHRLKCESRSVILNDPHPPLTLAEKHSDLLRFIAQKESKCFELRQQLATQEAELLTLKRKWERIVSRSLHDDQRSVPSGSDPSTQSTVLSGLKDSMQGVGRLFTQLGDRRTFNTEQQRHGSDSSVSTTASSASHISELSMSSAKYSASTSHSESEEGTIHLKTGRPVSISLSKVVRRRAYESSPPASPLPVIHASDVTIRRVPSPIGRSPSYDVLTTRKRNSAVSGSLAPASSMLGVIAGAPLAAVADGVGKILGQIQSQTCDQHSESRSFKKRASTLLLDTSQTLLAALAPLPSASVETVSSRRKSGSPSVLQTPSKSSHSYIDDDDILGDETGTRWAAMEALSLDISKADTSNVHTQDLETKSSDSGSDVWKW